jgi:hypothetical protein
MKRFPLLACLMVLAILFLVSAAPAQDCRPGGFSLQPASVQPIRLPAAQVRVPQAELIPGDVDVLREALRAEQEFKRNGPQLFTMDDALVLQAKTGKPVVCWMGKHLFASAKARAESLKLADTTIQAVMDGDGTEGTLGSDGKVIPVHRVKFSDGGYRENARTAYIPLNKFDENTATKILQFTRGGK